MCEATLAFVGDIYWGENDQLSISPDILRELGQADLVIGNQEGPITEIDDGSADKCHLRSRPGTARALRDSGFDVVSLANNHMFDHGLNGFLQTRESLARAGVQCLGGGTDLGEATCPLVVEINGLKIGLLAYSSEFIQTTCATDSNFGCAPLVGDLMVRDIRKLASRVDTVIVLPHWGYCEYAFPTPEQIDLVPLLFEAGAVAVIGSHSHGVQGIDARNDKLVAYSLGDFLFADYTDQGRTAKLRNRPRSSRESMILRVCLAPGRVVRYDVIFARTRDDRVELDSTPRRLAELDMLSRPLGTGDYPRHWRNYVRRRLVRRILFYANVLNWRRIRKDTFQGIGIMLRILFRW